MNHHSYLVRTFHPKKDLTQIHVNKSANVCFYDSENSATHGDKTSPGKRFDCSTAFAFFGPLSVTSKSMTCRSGETGNFRIRSACRKQAVTDFDEIFGLGVIVDCYTQIQDK